MRWPPPLRSSGISAASLGSAVIITRWPPFNTSGSIFCAALPTSQWPSLVIPMGTASYLSGSRPRITEAAEARETSCSPERPPKRMPTRSRFFSGVMELVFWVIGRPLLVIGQRGTVVAGELEETFANRNGSRRYQRGSENGLQDLLAQGREDQLDPEQSSAVVFVQNGIDLDYFH